MSSQFSHPPNPIDSHVTPHTRKWTICVLLLFATMLNYMDRQTLSSTIPDIQKELLLTDAQYGYIEFGFGIAFAAGGLAFGIIADRTSIRWLYPAVLLGWSLAGVATAWAAEIGAVLSAQLVAFHEQGGWAEATAASLALLLDVQLSELKTSGSADQAYLGFLACRITLGFFEAGQWPCALIATQRLLSRQELSFGNSLAQSGAAIGAIVTPIIVQMFGVSVAPGRWTLPFVTIGFGGIVWIFPWLLIVRGRDLARREESDDAAAQQHAAGAVKTGAAADTASAPYAMRDTASRDAATRESAAAWWNGAQRFGVLVVVVIMINLTWQFFRTWLPKFLRDGRGYSAGAANYFTSGYYIAADVGCIAVGWLVRKWSAAGMEVHRARLITFTACALLTALAFVAIVLPAGYVLLGVLLLIAAGSLGLFPNYYAFTQGISRKHQGKVTGMLGAITWIVSALMQASVGKILDRTQSYTAALIMAGTAPLIAVVALWLFWPRTQPVAKEQKVT